MQRAYNRSSFRYVRILFLTGSSYKSSSLRSARDECALAKLDAHAARTQAAERNRVTYECHREYHWPGDYWLLSEFGASQDTAFLSLIVFASHLAARFQFGAVVHFADTRPRRPRGLLSLLRTASPPSILRRFRVTEQARPEIHSPALSRARPARRGRSIVRCFFRDEIKTTMKCRIRARTF